MTYTVNPLIEQLRAARIAQDLTQLQVGRRIGRSGSAVAKWERGAEVPKISNLIAWADALGLRLTLEDAT